MHTRITAFLCLGLTTLAVALPARAQLLFSGSSRGVFVDPGLKFTSVSNGPVISEWASGVPYRPQKPYYDTPTFISFTGQSWSDVSSGAQLDLGKIWMKNGIDLLHTTASWASMDLFIADPTDGVGSFKLTTLTFSVHATPNPGGTPIPDQYLVKIGTVNPFTAGGRKFSFDLKLSNPAFGTGTGVGIAENKSSSVDLLADIHFTPVPEPSTYAACAGLLLVGLAGLRRIRGTRVAQV